MATPLERLQGAQRIGFLYSGGSARCAFQIGVTETLYAAGIHPSVCLGVSAGSWNAAAVAVGNWRRLRAYWRFFCRMPYVDVWNIAEELSPFIWKKLHARAFRRYIGEQRLHDDDALPLYIALTRLRDKQSVIMHAQSAPDPFKVLLASNYLPPFYTRPQKIDGESYGDGGYANNLPYDALFEVGCDMVVIMASKGESEGGLFRSPDDVDHVIPPEYDDRCVVIRPRHRMPLRFVERNWDRLAPIADLGALRAREVLYGERHAATDLKADGRALSYYLAAMRQWVKRRGAGPVDPLPE
jgi:predicted acylesterase/phospholipase RssA